MLPPTVKPQTLEQGEILVCPEPALITTTLGSCVSVCLWEPRTRAGAMNHFALPSWPGQGEASAKYGDVAMTQMLNRYLALGLKLNNVRAMVFGGASMHESPVLRVGAENVGVALRIMALENIPVVMKEVGGVQGRRIAFDTYAGKVTVEQV